MAYSRNGREGKVYKRSDGRWCAQVVIAGKRVTVYGRTQHECREWARKVSSTDPEEAEATGSNMTVAEYLVHWLRLAEMRLRPTTAHQYARLIEGHILPTLGGLPLGALRAEHIQALVSAKVDSGTGPATVILSLGVLRCALGQAHKWGMIDRNPAVGVVKPRQRRREMRTLSAEQARRLVNVAEGTRYAALLQLAMTTGMRQGEILALRWSDIDFESGCLMVQRQLKRVSGRGLIFSEPKSRAGRRKVVLGPGMLGALKRQRDLVEVMSRRPRGRWHENDLVFPSSTGTPQEPRNVLAAFKTLLRRASLPDIRFHDLRHTAASLMLQQGIHPKVVQERLGHSTISITLDIYSHVLPSLQDEAAEKLDSLLAAGVTRAG